MMNVSRFSLMALAGYILTTSFLSGESRAESLTVETLSPAVERLPDGMGLSGGRGTANLTMMNIHTQINPAELNATIKLGIDAPAKCFYVGRLLDGATSPPVQKMTFDGLLRFVAKQQDLAREVIIDSRHLLFHPF